MQVFEFHFNPPSADNRHKEQDRTKAGLIFDSFCYEPANIYEKKAGGLYMAGLLKNTLPHNAGFINNLAKIIKDRYYQTTTSSPEKSLKESLKKANQYLESIAGKGDIGWLGNISFSTLSAAASGKGYEFNFTKVGEIKIFLLRNGHLIDIDQKLQFEGIEPYPLKIFGNIISGKLIENDVVLVFTKEVLNFFFFFNILFDICKIQSANPLAPNGNFDHKKLKEILNTRKEDLANIHGIFLAITLSKESPIKEKGKFSASRQTIFLPDIRKIFSNKQLIALSLPKLNFAENFRLPDFSVKNLRKIFNIRFPLPVISNALNHLARPKFDLKSILIKSNSGLIVIFIIFLTIGFLVFQQKERQQISQYKLQLEQIKEKTEKAEAYITMAQYNSRSRNQANILLKEGLDEISGLVKISPSLPKNLTQDAKLLEEKILDNLFELNKLKIITNPKIIFEFRSHEFAPQKMILVKDKIYLFNPFTENIFELIINNEGKMLTFGKKISLAAELDNSIMFLVKSGEFATFANGNFSDTSSLKNPYAEFALSDIVAYYSNLYVLDNKNSALIKYPYLGGTRWADPQIWLENESVSNIKSIAIDGSVWALTTNDKIQRYYAQRSQGDLKFDIFPSPKNFSKIFTSISLPYLYLSESSQKRIVILNKSGQIEGQIQSESFDNLLDFAVSENGKAIYILNGPKIYQIDL